MASIRELPGTETQEIDRETDHQRKVRWPKLVEQVVQTSKLRFYQNGEDIVLQHLGRALIDCGVKCTVMQRGLYSGCAIDNQNGKVKHNYDSLTFLVVLKMKNEVFNLNGSAGWDQILQEHLDGVRGVPGVKDAAVYNVFKWMDPEKLSGELGYNYPLEGEHLYAKLVQTITTIQSSNQKKMLTRVTQDRAETKMSNPGRTRKKL